ncbi:ABC-type taurine transporter, substrate-binding lipoprotein [Corynebacterium glyciniphilum AJ 3170]|uniref:ABC-type taurine transporter, substrate-binding lipoprotein n=1 Tax=Corynebacterium glyciniphilum AJ 3170 TaxID=1404245 RepID=X5E4Q8_9CORY|nr:glycine betaine ABC transporter substrate-binding protein [Corynebacterium glyciniphilum]AHW62465.1 ABC-type taurine transporter, substrate-binding lipoprotein [Corynebacterium glyciniphilum AJ 3170]
MTLRRTGALCAALALTTVAGCVGPPASEWKDKGDDVVCPVKPADAQGKVRIGYLGGPATDLYTQATGLAEACLPHADVEWTRYPTGQDIVQGFAAGSVDLAALGSTPTTKALSAPLDLDVSVVQANSVIGTTEALVAKNADDIKDLKGGRIAVPFSSTAHYSLLNALIDAGIDPSRDVEVTNISPDKLPAAWKSDRIDAAYVWDPTLQELKDGTGGSTPGTVLTDSEQQAARGHATYNVTLASNPWIDAHAELLRTWLDLEAWVVDGSAGSADSDGPNDFVSVNATASGMDEAAAELQVNGQQFISATDQVSYLDDVAAALRSTADFLVEQGDIPTAKRDYSDVVRTDLWEGEQ